jgi:hypothetical protein
MTPLDTIAGLFTCGYGEGRPGMVPVEGWYPTSRHPIFRKQTMADSHTSPSSPDDMHWGISYLRGALQDVKQKLRDFRKEVADQFKETAGQFKDVAVQFSDQRKETAEQFKEVRSEIRHSMVVTMGYTTILTTILLGMLVAFLQYRLLPN